MYGGSIARYWCQGRLLSERVAGCRPSLAALRQAAHLGVMRPPRWSTNLPMGGCAMSTLAVRLVALCAPLALLASCESRTSRTPPGQSASDQSPTHYDTIVANHPLPAADSDSVRADLRVTCRDAAEIARTAGARRVVIRDTILERDRSASRSGACMVQAQEFDSSGVDPNLYKLQSDKLRLKWHPFEGTGGDSTYALDRATLQCEVTILAERSATNGSHLLRGRASGSHIFCYPD